MKPVALVDATTRGTLGDNVQSIKMGFDENSIEHLLMLLTDLYSDKPLAVIREYSTNARDAHIEAGVKRPIEVSLPSGLSPFFKVRDYGVGMDADDIANVYSKYGASSKRESNDTNGMLGIGGKSALTYTTQFTVTAIKNGRKINVVVSRVGSVAQMQIVGNVATTEPSGVEISVPIKNGDAGTFVDKANRLFSFWDKGTVLVNGQEPKSREMKQVTPNVFTTNGIGHDVVVMAGVPYPVERRLFDGRNSWQAFDVVAFVATGDVAITPSREALMHNTKSTDTTLANIKRDFTAAIRKSIQDDVNSATDKHEGYTKFKAWKEQFGYSMPSGITYRGTPFPGNFNFNYARWQSNSYRYSFNSGYRTIGADEALGSVVVTGFDVASLSPRHKEKIKAWKAAQGISTALHVFLKDASVPSDLASWIDPKRIVTWDDIKAVVLPKATPAGPRKKPSVDIRDHTTGRAVAQPVDLTKTPLYVSPTANLYSSHVVSFYGVFPNTQIVEIGKNRWDKFERDYKGAQELKDFLRKKLSEARDNLTPKDIVVKGFQDNTWDKRKVAVLPKDRILDPNLVTLIEIANGDTKSATLDEYNKIQKIANTFGVYDSDFPVQGIEGYPLLDDTRPGTLEQEHTIIYLNAVYLAAQNEENTDES